MDTETVEPQEAMLPWSPFKVGPYCDACKAIIFNEDLCFLAYTVFKEGPEPWIRPTRHVDYCCCDKIVPFSVSDKSEVNSYFTEHTKM
jgi:hypothetical protein